MTDKRAVRRAMRARRMALTECARAQAAQDVAGRILAWPVYRAARTVFAYVAARGELDLGPVLCDALASGRTLLLPRCEADGAMTARRVQTLDELAPGTWGLDEPGPDAPVCAPGRIDLALVPGVAFGRDGVRVGQGGGYYDRYLPGLRGVAAGVGYDFQIVDGLQASAHDVPVAFVVTPGGIIRCGQE